MAEIINKKDFSEKYIDTLIKAGLIDYGPVKGTIIFKPYSYRIWEKLQKLVDDEIKKLGAQNVYFPLFIPEKYLEKEKKHFEGFSPEVAVVTFAGGEELKEKLIVRPTSETIIYSIVSNWIKSYRDLPLILNQWCNVVRWEKRPFPFFRNTEFLWQEGHSFHTTHKESLNLVLKVLDLYQKIYQNILSIFGYSGKKSEKEKFAGALTTYTYEILIPDGKALQGCTSHDLGQNFSKAFGIKFQDKDKKLKFVWQNSWGLSTRALGAVLAHHLDDNGLVLPSKIAPYQIVIVPIYDKKNDDKIRKYSLKLKEELKDYDVYFDDSSHSPGFKFNEWELKGVPLRIEIGKKEFENNVLTCFRRDENKRFSISFSDLKNNLEEIFKEYDNNLFEKSKNFTQKNTHYVENYQEFKKVIQNKKGFIFAFWCGNRECEDKIKEETKATTRCLPLNSKEEKGKCVYCGRPAKYRWLFAQSY